MPLGLLLALAGTLAGGEPLPADLSYLYQPAFCMDHALRCPVRPYVPQPGDLFLATDTALWAKMGHWLAGTGAPQHSGIVVARPDGQLALLEAGPHNDVYVEVADLLPQLATYGAKERVWIRQRCVPLTEDQCRRLTAFALAVDRKPFATVRLVCQITPFRCRGPFRCAYLGKCIRASFARSRRRKGSRTPISAPRWSPRPAWPRVCSTPNRLDPERPIRAICSSAVPGACSSTSTWTWPAGCRRHAGRCCRGPSRASNASRSSMAIAGNNLGYHFRLFSKPA